MSLEYRASGERQYRTEPVLLQQPGHGEDDVQVSALDVFYEMDGLEYRQEDARDVKRNDLIE